MEPHGLLQHAAPLPHHQRRGWGVPAAENTAPAYAGQLRASRFNSRNVQFLFTGDIISGKNRCSIGDLADCLFTCWRSDPVHGDKSAYMKIAVGILDFLSPPPRNSSGPAQRKRSREDSSPSTSRSVDRDRGGRDRERASHERREDHRSRSAYNSYPSCFRGGRGRGGSGGNRRFF